MMLIPFFFEAQAQKTIRTISGKKIKAVQLDQLIKQTIDSLGIAGISIAIINNAEIKYLRTFGVMNKETRQPIDANTIFEAASLSKPLFAYFFMKMAEKRVVSLDEPIYNTLSYPWPKENDERYKLITPRLVLSHQTGFPNWANNKLVELKFTPGDGFSYSGEAYQHLTAWLATKNDTNWQAGLEEIFQKEVAKPLAMQHTYFIGNESFKETKATGYEDTLVKKLWLPKSFGAAHTLHSEVADYANFLLAMIKGEGLTPASFNEMLKEQNHFKPENELLKHGQTGWCLGFAMKPTKYGMSYLHTGNNTGFRSFCSFNKEKKYGLVFFINSNKISAFHEILGKFLDDEF